MMKRAVVMTVLLGTTLAAAAADTVIPPELEVPAGERLLLKAHAQGQQIYVCKTHPGGPAQWELKGPDAELRTAKGAVIGHHFAGPTWKHKDGSEVTGKASAHVDSPDAASIPWLLLAATGHTGSGVFAKVTSVQRLNTHGGKPPAASECTAAKEGTESKSDYTADYYFYTAAGK